MAARAYEEAPDIDFGADEVEAEELPVTPGESLDFTPSELKEAESLRGVPTIDVLNEFARRTMGGDSVDLKDPRTKLKDFVRYCVIIGSLGSSHMIDEGIGAPLGKDLSDFSIPSLKARLVRSTSTVTLTVTPWTLPTILAKLHGASVQYPARSDLPAYEEGNDFAPDAYDHVEVKIPGAPTVYLGGEGRFKGAIIKGGEEYIRWHNSMFKTAYVYLKVPFMAQALAFLLVSVYSITYRSESKVNFLDKVFSKSGTSGKLPTIPLALRVYLTKLKAAVSSAYSVPEFRPIMGVKKNVQDYTAALLFHAIRGASPVGKENLKKMTSLIESSYADEVAKLSTTLPQFFSNGLGVDIAAVGKFPKERPILPNGEGFGVYSSLGKYVQECRTTVRHGNDIPRKSDAPAVLASLGTASSVAGKVSRAVGVLQGMAGIGKFPRVDAYGTHVANHWSQEVERVSDDLMYYDISRDFAPAFGKFSVGDVEKIEVGAGQGKFIFDDTLSLPSNFAQGDMSRASLAPKVNSIIGAKYEGGFMKLYMGCASDGETRLGMVPPYLEPLLMAYNSVVLLPGGSYHSPEFFVVFYGRNADGAKLTLAPRSLTEDGEVKYGLFPALPTEGLTKDLSYAAYRKYVGNWYLARAYEVVRSNVLLNLQVRMGALTHYMCKTWIPHTPRINTHLGGLDAPDRHVNAAGLPANEDAVGPDVDFEI